MNGCIYSPTTSGYIKIGKQEVPIVNKQVLQGGLLREEEPFVKVLVAAKNGETLTKTAQKVPGGLLDFVECTKISNFIVRILCESVFENGLTGVNAVTELAAPASSVVLNTFSEATGLGPEQGYPPALRLPVKVKLENPLFGSECYIGSNSEPIELSLTTGATSPPAPNKSIHGKLGELTSKAGGEILVIKHNTLVGNAFAVGKAHGCGLLGVLDGLIESKLGLPSAAGKNTAVLNNTVEQAGHYAVEESE